MKKKMHQPGVEPEPFACMSYVTLEGENPTAGPLVPLDESGGKTLKYQVKTKILNFPVPCNWKSPEYLVLSRYERFNVVINIE